MSDLWGYIFTLLSSIAAIFFGYRHTTRPAAIEAPIPSPVYGDDYSSPAWLDAMWRDYDKIGMCRNCGLDDEPVGINGDCKWCLEKSTLLAHAWKNATSVQVLDKNVTYLKNEITSIGSVNKQQSDKMKTMLNYSIQLSDHIYGAGMVTVNEARAVAYHKPGRSVGYLDVGDAGSSDTSVVNTEADLWTTKEIKHLMHLGLSRDTIQKCYIEKDEDGKYIYENLYMMYNSLMQIYQRVKKEFPSSDIDTLFPDFDIDFNQDKYEKTITYADDQVVKVVEAMRTYGGLGRGIPDDDYDAKAHSSYY